MKTTVLTALAGFGVTAAVILAPVHSHGQTVGAAAAVKPSSTGTPPGGSARTLNAGTEIVNRERIQTSGSGTLQVMFNDKSTLTIGPNSDMVIDEFVYQPNASGGTFAVGLTKGALRFVGGQISHTTGAKISTPVATLVARGGAAFVAHDAECARTSSRGNCSTFVCTGGACQVTSRLDSQTFRLRVNQAVEIGTLGAVQFNVSSVNLNNVSRGGGGGIVGAKRKNKAAKFSGRSTIEQTVREQTREPAPPPVPQ